MIQKQRLSTRQCVPCIHLRSKYRAAQSRLKRAGQHRSGPCIGDQIAGDQIAGDQPGQPITGLGLVGGVLRRRRRSTPVAVV